MKNKILPSAIFIIGVVSAANVFAQSKKFFAVTGEQMGSVNWIAFRQSSLDENSAIKTLYIPAADNETLLDAANGQKIISNNAGANAPATAAQTCGCLNNRMVAAIAYDAKNNRLYYTPMLSNQLRYLDLNSSQPKSYTVSTQLLKNFSNKPGEASVITRMCFASDNYGYALTNDNEHLIRFSTGRQTAITDLGKLIDAESNGENSVKTEFKSWGGDLIADANGNLYLFAMQRGVYKINPNTKLATFLGVIKNIPDDYTINAAMVDENDNNVIVGSSTKTTNYYRVNLITLQATEIAKKTDKVYNVSDFANANLAFHSNNANAVAKMFDKNSITVYPNPVKDGNITVQFNNIAAGKYVVQVTEQEGKTVLQKAVNVSGSQKENFYITSVTANQYLIRVINQKGETVYTNKIIISR